MDSSADCKLFSGWNRIYSVCDFSFPGNNTDNCLQNRHHLSHRTDVPYDQNGMPSSGYRQLLQYRRPVLLPQKLWYFHSDKRSSVPVRQPPGRRSSHCHLRVPESCLPSAPENHWSMYIRLYNCPHFGLPATGELPHSGKTLILFRRDTSPSADLQQHHNQRLFFFPLHQRFLSSDPPPHYNSDAGMRPSRL